MTDIKVGQTVTFTPKPSKPIKGKVVSVAGYSNPLLGVQLDSKTTISVVLNNYTYEIEKPKLPTKLGSVIYVRAPNGYGYSGHYYKIGTNWYDVNGAEATPTYLEQTNWSIVDLDTARITN